MGQPLKFILAPNALKGSCSASIAARALAAGAARAATGATLVLLPVADGGDGLTAVLGDALEGERRTCRVSGPLGDPLAASLLWLPARATAVIEMAQASGLALLPPAVRDPTRTSTFGTGELIRHALDLGARRILVGLGGSATNDGGIGMASALGWRFLDTRGRPVPPNGGALARIARVDGTGVDPRLATATVQGLCDVDNPLTGPRGAAAVYGPQKGATAAQIGALDAGLAHLADLLSLLDHPPDLRATPGGGAAGGLGAGLIAFCGATLQPGAELVLDLLDLDRHLTGATLVLTAEGRIDTQTIQGKAPAAVAARARRQGVPCIAIAGAIGAAPGEERDLLHTAGFDALFSLCPGPLDLKRAEADAETLLAAAAEQVVRAFLAGWASTLPAGRAPDRPLREEPRQRQSPRDSA